MAETSDWEFPPDLQPDAGDYAFDLERTLDSMVLLRAEIPEDAFTAPNLGTERVGNGIVIREDGIVLTIGYIITEASAIWLTTNKGGVVPAYALAYDQASGFGLVQALGAAIAPGIGGLIADAWGLMATFYFLAGTIVVANLFVFLMPDVGSGAVAKG